ncbi:MFS transporter [Nodosilinea sp. LEGE 07298]|uniref:MFS transporter n=1 Tax=Nodosilinea sp. LEGE 07298 TaxID=2777970 RepID=UPI001881E088|nr:MFS transporter [Nodosilinea sp. LEGE 07298]MBE9109629.1 MFS transporter [Nodosilinea sp. LEGE 07298]
MTTSARSQVALLALCQALAMTTNTVLITTAALIGYALATDKALATLPLAVRQIATMATTVPASLLMQRFGRRSGFLVGTLVGVIGAGIAIYSLAIAHFWLFTIAMGFLGVANSFVGYYRFAAADVADEAWRSQAISWVIAGGIIAAVLGPWLATGSQGWFNSELYIGAMVAVLALQVVTSVLLLGLHIPPVSNHHQALDTRPLGQIMRQPRFLVAALGSTVSYGIMVFVMTTTPLAMAAEQHSFGQTASVIQWHVFGMFAPSLVTGWLIQRLGVLSIIQAGAVMALGCMGLNLAGTSFWHFAIALLLLGIGWNFMYVGSTTLLTETHTPTEKGKVQAAHDFVVFSFVALMTLLSGRVFDRFDWMVLNQISWPLVLATFVAVLWLQQSQIRNRRPRRVG